MNIKGRIQENFITAMKAKDEIAKSALSGIKAKITEAEKSINNQELSDAEVVKVLTKAIKQRRESQEIYEKAGRPELARKEADEACVLEMFMPARMTEDEIQSAVMEIVASHPPAVLNNPNALVGKTMGEFNKKYSGRADASTVMEIIKKQIENA